MKLQIPKSNRKDAEYFLSTSIRKYSLPNYVVQHGYRLLASKTTKHLDGMEQTICLIASRTDNVGNTYHEIAYKVKVLARHGSNAYLRDKNATQVLVWRSPAPRHERVLAGFAAMFFRHLLDNHNIMITDEQQTEDGRRFWVRRILEAFEQEDVCVAYIDLNNLDETLAPRLHMINDDEEFLGDYYQKGWGNDESHKDRAFLISKKENLPSN